MQDLEKLVRSLESEFPAPELMRRGDRHIFRHAPEEKTDLLMCQLKLIRNLSLLHASICLMKGGFVQETYVLTRLIDEGNEDITFLCLPREQDEPSDNHKKLVDEFFQEELADFNDLLSNMPRHRVPRKKIRAALA